MGCSFSGLNALYDNVNGATNVWINENRFRILRKLGEGGFSYIYLVKEVVTDSSPALSGGGLSKKLKDSSHVSERTTMKQSQRDVRFSGYNLFTEEFFKQREQKQKAKGKGKKGLGGDQRKHNDLSQQMRQAWKRLVSHRNNTHRDKVLSMIEDSHKRKMRS